MSPAYRREQHQLFSTVVTAAAPFGDTQTSAWQVRERPRAGAERCTGRSSSSRPCPQRGRQQGLLEPRCSSAVQSSPLPASDVGCFSPPFTGAGVSRRPNAASPCPQHRHHLWLVPGCSSWSSLGAEATVPSWLGILHPARADASPWPGPPAGGGGCCWTRITLGRIRRQEP